jgi:hypothetical protein
MFSAMIIFLYMWPTLQVINLKPSEYGKSTKIA